MQIFYGNCPTRWQSKFNTQQRFHCKIVVNTKKLVKFHNVDSKLKHFSSWNFYTLHGRSNEVTLSSPVRTVNVWQTLFVDQTRWCFTRRPNSVKHVWINETLCTVLSNVWRHSDCVKYDQTRCPNGKMFARHFGRAFYTYPSQRHFWSLLQDSKNAFLGYLSRYS